jgi:4-amino-4-deoxy-L-arabinose transferase-like glycosyltransferase
LPRVDALQMIGPWYNPLVATKRLSTDVFELCMKLHEIDKSRYSKHYKIVFSGIVVVLLGVAVGSSAILIQLFGEPGGSNFWLNLIGVVIAAAVVVTILLKIRSHPFMTEVVYVWDLKQVLNRIYRKERKLNSAMQEDNDPDAMVIMNYFYKGSKQLYELDDNRITHDELTDKIRVHDKHLEAAGLSTSTDNFEPSMLEWF